MQIDTERSALSKTNPHRDFGWRDVEPLHLLPHPAPSHVLLRCCYRNQRREMTSYSELLPNDIATG